MDLRKQSDTITSLNNILVEAQFIHLKGIEMIKSGINNAESAKDKEEIYKSCDDIARYIELIRTNIATI